MFLGEGFSFSAGSNPRPLKQKTGKFRRVPTRTSNGSNSIRMEDDFIHGDQIQETDSQLRK